MPEQDSELTNAQLAAVCRQFASLMHAEINILDIFDTLREQSDSAFFQEVIDSVREDVEMGRTLATAFSRYPQTFSPFFISMVRQGELEGELDRTFDLLADHFESRMDDTVDAHRRREEGAFDLETVAAAFQWLARAWSGMPRPPLTGGCPGRRFLTYCCSLDLLCSWV